MTRLERHVSPALYRAAKLYATSVWGLCIMDLALVSHRHRICLSMGCVKDDDSTITWDAKAMQKGTP